MRLVPLFLLVAQIVAGCGSVEEKTTTELDFWVSGPRAQVEELSVEVIQPPRGLFHGGAKVRFVVSGSVEKQGEVLAVNRVYYNEKPGVTTNRRHGQHFGHHHGEILLIPVVETGSDSGGTQNTATFSIEFTREVPALGWGDHTYVISAGSERATIEFHKGK